MRRYSLLVLLLVLVGCSGQPFVGQAAAHVAADAGPVVHGGGVDASPGDGQGADGSALDAASSVPPAHHGGHGGSDGTGGTGGAVGTAEPDAAALIDSGDVEPLPVVDAGSDASSDAGACVPVSFARDGWAVSAFSTSQITQGAPELAIDGQQGTRWQSGVAQGSQSPEWFQVDLGQAVRVRRVVLYSQIVGDQAQALSIVVSNDALDLNAAPIASVVSAGLTTAEVELDGTGRYLLLQQTGASSAWWSINELTVIGCVL